MQRATLRLWSFTPFCSLLVSASAARFEQRRYANSSFGGEATPMQQSTAAATPGTSSSSSSSEHRTTSQETFTNDSLTREILSKLASPIPVGTLFRSLSPQGKQFLASQRISIEQFMLRNPTHFSVFQEPKCRVIMASLPRHLPGHALVGVEATADKLFDGGKKNDSEMQAIITVLKYIPNEWSAFVDLGIPEQIRVTVMDRKAKAFFQKYPQYFEVQAQGLASHTFFVRRSMALQRQTQQGETTGGVAAPQT